MNIFIIEMLIFFNIIIIGFNVAPLIVTKEYVTTPISNPIDFEKL